MEETKIRLEQMRKMGKTVKCDMYIFWIYFWFVVVIEIVVAYALQEIVWWCERWHVVLVIEYLSAIYGNGQFSVICEYWLGGSNLDVRWKGAVCHAKTLLSMRHSISLHFFSPSPLSLWYQSLRLRYKFEYGATIVRRAWRPDRCRRMRMLWSLLHHIVMFMAYNQQGHGTLHAIYASIERACAVKGWSGVDLLIIGGDFQVLDFPMLSWNQQQMLISQKNSQYEMHMIYNVYPCQQNTAICTISTNTTPEHAKHPT